MGPLWEHLHLQHIRPLIIPVTERLWRGTVYPSEVIAAAIRVYAQAQQPAAAGLRHT